MTYRDLGDILLKSTIIYTRQMTEKYNYYAANIPFYLTTLYEEDIREQKEHTNSICRTFYKQKFWTMTYLS